MTVPHILVVEDNEDDFILVEDFLSEAEFRITWCPSANVARDKLSQERFDLVLLDHGLPDANSLSFLEEIHAQHPNLPVIVLTGRDDQALAVSAVKKGATNYLLKDEIFEHLLPSLYDALGIKEESLEDSALTTSRESRFIDRAERIYRVLLETMGEGCLVVSPDGIITLVNEAIGRLVGCEANLLLGRQALDIFTLETKTILRQNIRQASKAYQEEAATFEGILCRQDGSELPVLLSIRSMYAESGQYEATLLILTDISEQVRAKQELAALYQKEHEQHSRLQALIESSRDGIILIGVDFRLLVINTQAIRLLGLLGSTEDWINKSIFEILTALAEPAMQDILLSELQSLLPEDEEPASGEVEIKLRTIQWLNLPVRASTTPLGQLLVLRDITERRLVEKLRDDLTSTMVHDLRNPLGVIWNSLEIIEELDEMGMAPMTKQQRTLTTRAMEATNKMLKLVNNILIVSRLESGRIPLDLNLVAVIDLVNSSMQGQMALAAEKSIELQNNVPSILPPVWADFELIGRVLQNLLENAIKFTPYDGQVSISAELSQDANQMKISVSDNGSGIPLDLQSRLFQKFTTGHQKGRGSGLGLAFCKLAVEAQQGKIWLESTPNQGSTFTFTLPVGKLEG